MPQKVFTVTHYEYTYRVTPAHL